MKLSALSMILLVVSACAQERIKLQEFHWNWRRTQTADTPLPKASRLSSKEQTGIQEEITKQLGDDAYSKFSADDLYVKLIDLNGDGIPEVFAQGPRKTCSVTGNCPLWVFQKTGSAYRLLMFAEGIQTFTIQPTRSGGSFDLVLSRHESATEQDLSLVQFRDGHYRQSGCYVANWTYRGDDGEFHDLRNPRIRTCQNRNEEMNSCNSSVMDNTDRANLIVVARVKSLGPRPGTGEGSLPSKQSVTFEVESVLKGTYASQEFPVDYKVAGESPFFHSGDRLVVFLRAFGKKFGDGVVDPLEGNCGVMAASSDSIARVKRAIRTSGLRSSSR